MESITPMLARAYLATSHGNRPLKRAKVAAYARDMAAGQWQQNGETIIFDRDGHIIDGHHRLTACVAAGASFPALVVRGVPPSTRNTIDMGASRTIGDALSFHGYKNSNHINAVVMALFSLQNGRPKSVSPSASEVFDFVQKNPDVVQAGVIAARKHIPRAQAVCGAIWFVAKINGEQEQAEAFLDVLISGVPSGLGCAAHALRERIMRDAISSRKISVQDVHRLVVAAWEKFRVGEKAKIIKIPQDYKITGWGQ